MTAKEICKKFETSEGSFYLLPYTIKKISSYGIDVPIEIASTAKNSLFKDFSQGIYLWIHKGIIRKVGLFGEGVKSNFNSRYASYRTTSLLIEKNKFRIKNLVRISGSTKDRIKQIKDTLISL